MARQYTLAHATGPWQNRGSLHTEGISMAPARPLVAVFGSSTAVEPDAVWTLAYDLGAALGAAGADVMTGGYGGAMAACSRGAHDAGANVVGVTVDLFERRGPVNRWVKERVHTPDLYERLRHIVS